MAALLCLLCLPAALALHVQRLDMRMASRESYFFGSRSKPTAAPSQTLHSPSAFVERESERVAAPAVSKTSYSFGARVPRTDRSERPVSERVGLFRESSEEKGYAATPSQPEGRNQMRVDYSFGARLRSPSVPRPRSSEPAPVAVTSEPYVSSRSVETPSVPSSKVDYSFGARLKREHSSPSQSSRTEVPSYFSEEPRRVETAPAKVNYSFGARLKPMASQPSSPVAMADVDMASSRSSTSRTETSSSVSSGMNFSFGARLPRHTAQESAPKSSFIREAVIDREPSRSEPVSSSSAARESYFFGSRSQSPARKGVQSRSGSLVGV